MTDVSVLDVNLYGEPIGTLTHVGGDRSIFAFTDGYIEDPGRPTLGLAFKDEFGELRSEFRAYQKRIMPFLSNLLPEGRPRRYLAERAGVNHEREFHLLWALGCDLPGAITVSSANGVVWSPDYADDDGQNGNHRAGPLRFSLAGVQVKFSAVTEPPAVLSFPPRAMAAHGSSSFLRAGLMPCPRTNFR